MQETRLAAWIETYTKRTWEHAHLFKEKSRIGLVNTTTPKKKKVAYTGTYIMECRQKGKGKREEGR